jgi:hypothetical protein
VIQAGTDIQSAINAAPEGTTFCLQAGVYRLTQGIVPKSNDTLGGAPGTILNGAKLLTSFTQENSYFVASGQTQHNPVVMGECSRVTYTGCQYADAVFFDDRPLWRVMSLGEVVAGTFYFDYPNGKIYLADNPAGHKVEAAVATRAFRAFGTGVTGVTIRGLVIEKIANEAQAGALESTVWDLESNEVRLNHGVGIVGGGTIRGNYVHDNGQLGIKGGKGTNMLVENNEMAFNNNAGFDLSWEAGGGKWFETTSLTVRGNYSHDNHGRGLWTDTDNIYTLYENNRVENNDGIGILHEVSFDATIHDNTVTGNGFKEPGGVDGGGIEVMASPNVEIYGNTVSANRDGIVLTQFPRGSGAPGPHEINDVYVHNNVIKQSQGYTGLIQGMGDDSYFTSRNNRFQANTYYLGTNPDYFQWMDAPRTSDQWIAFGEDRTATFRQLSMPPG